MGNQSKTILAALALTFFSTSGYAHPTYLGYSGAPGSKGRCAASCHGSAGGTIEVSGFPSQYVPGQQYSITVSHNGGSAIKQFNGSCRIGSGSENAGLIEFGTNTSTYNTTGETNGVHLSSIDLDNATFHWTAPPAQTGDVTLYIAGHQGPHSGPNTDLTLVASELTTDVQEDGSGDVPAHYTLRDNYPNPFNPSTTIGFELPVKSHVELVVYNILGQRVATLVDEDLPPGEHEATWSGVNEQGVPVVSGVYFYRIKTEGFTKTRKMLLLK